MGLARVVGEEAGPRVEVSASKAIPAGIDAETQVQPPFRVFAAWLDAFNSGDPERYAGLLKRDFPFRGPALGDDLSLRARTGGFDLRTLRGVSATRVTGWVQERNSDQLVEFELTLEPNLQGVVPAAPVAARPYRIAALDLRGGSVPPSVQRPVQPLERSRR
jgi:hypothetical protein